MINKGLTTQQVEESRKLYGDNKIIEADPETFWDKVKAVLEDPMIRILLAIAGLMIIMSFFGQAEIFEVVGIIISVLLVTIISARTEMASDREYRKLKNSVKKEECKIYRDGQITQVEIDDIVVGDLVILQSGDKIPADGVLVSGDLKVDNAALNGEAEECKKTSVKEDFVYEDKELTGDTFVDAHSLFRGAVVCGGEGVMEIKKAGMNTMMGKMAEDMAGDEVMSPLKVKLFRLAEQISKFGYIGAVIIAIVLMGSFVLHAGGFEAYFAAGWLPIVKDLLAAAMLAVVIIVMAVPEGLPLMISIVLMQNTSKMLKHNVLVRKPIGIETAGSLNILFSDKTGTITKGHLEVVDFYDGNAVNHLNIFGQEPGNNSISHNLKLAIGKNTSAMFDNQHRVIGGNATDKALMQFLTEAGAASIEQVTVDVFQGFNSTNKYSASRIESEGKTFYKGAPEKLLANAVGYVDENGAVQALSSKTIDGRIDELAEKAMRVLAFAYSNKPLVENELPDDLVMIGMVGIRDDVRPEAKQAIEEVQAAGVQVVMITGDRKETAMAIAKEAGLIRTLKDLAISSEELGKMSDEEVKESLPNLRVVSRALPTDKSRIVRLAQELNLVCGMTGDGVNDAPALKRADVGFAMGSGTDVAKESAEIVIIDDNFQSIRNAILFGRTIYNNILKFIKFQLTINVSAVVVTALSPFFGIDEPLKITHILWINLVMDSLGALALGAEPALEKYMKEKPKRRDEAIVSKDVMQQVLFAGAWLTILSFTFLFYAPIRELFASDAAHLTGFFTLFVLTAVANGFNVRSKGPNVFEHIGENTGFCKVMGIIVLVQAVLTFVGGEFFSCTPFGITGWVVVLLMALSIIPVDMVRKLLFVKKI